MLHIQDYELYWDGAGLAHPLSGTVTARTTHIPISQLNQSAYREDQSQRRAAVAAFSGLADLYLPDDTEIKPAGLIWQVTRINGTVYQGTVPLGVTATVTYDDLLTIYGWSIVPTVSAPIYRETGPVGPQGSVGPRGYPNNVPDVWSAITTYTMGNGVVAPDGNGYICLLDNTNHQPPNATYWRLYVAGGAATLATVRTPGSVQQPVFNVHAFGAKGDLRTVFDGAITTGTAFLTSVSAVFTLADVGKVVHLPGAGPAGAPLVTTIASFQSSLQVTLASSASASVSGASLTWGTDDSGAISAAIAAAWAVAGIVVLAGLGYMLYAPLVLPVGDADSPRVTDRRLTICGQGAPWTYGNYQSNTHDHNYGTRLFYARTDGTDCMAAPGLIGHTRTTYRLEGMTIIGPDMPPLANGTGGTKTSGNGLYITGGTQGPPFVQSDDLEVVQFLGAGKGVWLDNVENSRISDLRTTGNDYGLKLTGCNANTFVNVQFQLNATRGLYETNCSSNVFVGGLMQSNIAAGMYLNGVVGAEFIATHFENNNTSLAAGIYGLMIVGTSGNFNEHVKLRSCRFAGDSQQDTIFMDGVADGYNVYITIDGGYCGINPPTKAVILNDTHSHDITISSFVAPSRVTDNTLDKARYTYGGQEIMRTGSLSTPSLAWNGGVIGMYYDPGTGSIVFCGPDGSGTLQQIIRLTQTGVTLKAPLIGLLPATVLGDLFNLTLNNVLRFRMDNAGNITLADNANLNLGSDGNTAGQLNIFGSVVGQRTVIDSNAMRWKRTGGGPSSINQEGGGGINLGTMNTALSAVINRIFIGVGDTAPITLVGSTAVQGSLATTGRTALGASPTPPTDAGIANSQASISVDEVGNLLKFRVRLSDGTLKTGSVPLA